MIILLWIYIASVVISLVGSIVEWNTEVDHKGWTKGRFFAACFVPISNTSYSISAIFACFKFFNRRQNV